MVKTGHFQHRYLFCALCDLSIDFFFTLYHLVSPCFLSGKNCEQCISGFFRLEDRDPTSVDVCQPCDCYTPGTVNGRMDCVQVDTITFNIERS